VSQKNVAKLVRFFVATLFSEKLMYVRTTLGHCLSGMTKYRVDRILPARRLINYRVDRGTMIMTC